MRNRRILAMLLLPLALVALLAPVHVHHGAREPSAEVVRHACDCGPGESLPGLASPHHHSGAELCWLPHQSALTAAAARPTSLVRLPPLPALGQAVPGTPLERLPACRGPPSLLA